LPLGNPGRVEVAAAAYRKARSMTSAAATAIAAEVALTVATRARPRAAP
jgi:hypothetical protein